VGRKKGARLAMQKKIYYIDPITKTLKAEGLFYFF